MGYKTLELTLISAKDLKNVNLIGKMDVYVVVYFSDDPKSKQKTPVHQDGGTSPSWNYTMRFTIDEAASASSSKYLVFQLKHEHTFGADKELGEVHVPVKELFSNAAPQFVTYQVKRGGKPKGELKFSFTFVDVGQNNVGYDAGSSSSFKPTSSMSSSAGGGYDSKPYPPPAGYPVDNSKASAAYLPQHGGYPPQAPPVGYPPQSQPPVGVPYGAPQGYPPQPGYGGYPPQPSGYGYPPPGAYPPQGGYPGYPPAGYAQAQKPQKQKKKKGSGFGLGAGLLGGVVGGLVLGEVLDDAFDGGFDDGGFDDGGFDGGFDF